MEEVGITGEGGSFRCAVKEVLMGGMKDFLAVPYQVSRRKGLA